MQVMLKRIGAFLLAVAASHASAELTVEEGHVRELIPGAASTAAYMTLHNTGTESLLLKSITSPAAGKITLHNTMNHNGMLHMMGMDSLDIPAGGAVVLQEGAIHMMLEEPTQPLQAGTSVELTLHFANGTTQTLLLPVRSVLE